MIIWLASYPRSGNTLFRMLLYHSYGVKTHSIYNDPLLEELGAGEIVGHDPLPAAPDLLANDQKIYFVKTHELPTDSNPAIYLIRDGRDVLVSYARFLYSFNQRHKTLRWLENQLGLNSFRSILRDLIRCAPLLDEQNFGGWSNNALAWTQRRKHGFTFIVRYEDLVINPEAWLAKALEALQLTIEPVSKHPPPGFDALHAQWPQFFRKGKIGGWQDEMSEALEELFWNHQAEAMNFFGYQRTSLHAPEKDEKVSSG